MGGWTYMFPVNFHSLLYQCWTGSGRQWKVHIFCNALDCVYWSVPYLHAEDPHGKIQVVLVTVKSKGGPKWHKSMPRWMCGLLLQECSKPPCSRRNCLVSTLICVMIRHRYVDGASKPAGDLILAFSACLFSSLPRRMDGDRALPFCNYDLTTDQPNLLQKGWWSKLNEEVFCIFPSSLICSPTSSYFTLLCFRVLYLGPKPACYKARLEKYTIFNMLTMTMPLCESLLYCDGEICVSQRSQLCWQGADKVSYGKLVVGDGPDKEWFKRTLWV